MVKNKQFERVFWLTVLLAIAFGALGYRLFDLQVLRHEELATRSQENSQREYLLEPRRGDILDAKGNPLATSIEVKTICADPSLIGTRQAEVARALAPLLKTNESSLVSRLQRTSQNANGETVTNHFVVLKKKVPVELWEQVQRAMTNLTFGVDESKLPRTEKAFYKALRQRAVFARSDQLRSYPNQTLAAQVLGYATSEEKKINGDPVNEMTGREGIEAKFDSKLAGVRGWRVTEADRRDRELVAMREQDVQACDGMNVVLTIDTVVQSIVEAELARGLEKNGPTNISGIVLRPRTGEILAMATLPTYDPNIFSRATEQEKRNRVISDFAEPGSTFKIVVVAGALNDKKVKLTDRFDCEHGRYYFGGKVLHDHESYGVLSAEEIIMKSSNIGAAKIGQLLGPQRLYEYIRDFGFGNLTGIPLPAEASGQPYVPPVSKWSKVSIAQIPMGQGVCATRLQMAMAMAAIANNGLLMRPMIVSRLEDSEHNVVAKFDPQSVRQVIHEDAARQMVQALKTVVSDNGTAKGARLDHYTVAGKTGTAQKSEKGVYVPGKYYSSFIGFFPADKPEVLISVVMDEPKHGYYGGLTAAPVFKSIAERIANYLNLRPEDGEAPGTPDTIATSAEERLVKTAAARARENNPNPRNP